MERLGLTWNPLTTQIGSHDWKWLYSDISRFGRVLIIFRRIAGLHFFGLASPKLGAQGSTGSSTMPHKVNPIRFENAEG